MRAAHDLRLRFESLVAHHGQTDAELHAHDPGTGAAVGYLRFSVFQGVPAISLIVVAPEWRRRGVATAMLQALQREHPGVEIEWGVLTADGARLRAAVATEEVEDARLRRRLALLAALRRRATRVGRLFAAALDHDGRARSRAAAALGERWNRLETRIWQLQEETWGARPTRRLVRTDDPRPADLSPPESPAPRPGR